MKTHRRLAFGAALIIGSIGAGGIASWSQAAQSKGSDKPLIVEQIDGTERYRLTLSKRAVERLAIKTKSVAADVRKGTKVKLSIPYSALIYDKTGATWVYTNPEPFVFIRASVTVVSIDRTTALLSNGPTPGTRVATVGVSELFGSELGIGGGH